MRIVIQSPNRRATIIAEPTGSWYDVRVAMGSKQGKTTLQKEELDGIVLGFLHKIAEDEAKPARPQEAVEKTA